MKTETKETCANCKYWKEDLDSLVDFSTEEASMVDADNHFGICRRYPPDKPSYDNAADCEYDEIEASQPETHQNRWCGEYRFARVALSVNWGKVKKK